MQRALRTLRVQVSRTYAVLHLRPVFPSSLLVGLGRFCRLWLVWYSLGLFRLCVLMVFNRFAFYFFCGFGQLVAVGAC